MKLNILPAKQGQFWIKTAFSLMRQQPFGLTGIFALLLTIGMLLSFVPVIGPFLSLAIIPTVSLCMMLAAEKVETGHMPMPSLLSEIVQVGKTQIRSLLTLGLLYALTVTILITTIAALSGDLMANVVKAQSDPNAVRKLMETPGFLVSILSMTFGMAIISMVFWHAPALVYWHRFKPLKSLFFSLVACVRNVKAYLVFGLGLLAVYFSASIVIGLVGSMVSAFMLPAMYIIYLCTSTLSSVAAYYAFKDSFIGNDEAATEPEPAPLPPPHLR